MKKELSEKNVYKALEKNANGMTYMDLQYRFFGVEEPTSEEVELLVGFICLNIFKYNIIPRKNNENSIILRYFGKNFIDENGNLK